MNSTVSPPTAASSTTSSATSTARLLLVRSEGNRTELNGPDAGPQSVGAGPRCSIRLDGPGLRPLHCVITPTEDGAVIRRWAAETMLNGADFTEATLYAGDIVRVGSIDLRVVEQLPSSTECLEEESPSFDDEQVGPAEPEVDAGAETATCAPESEDVAVAASEVAESEVAEASDEQPFASSTPTDEAFLPTTEENTEAPVDEGPAAGPLDPAVPSHLLKPWIGTDDDTHVAKRDTVTSAVPLNAFEEPEPASPQASEPAEATPLAGEWAVDRADTIQDAEKSEPAAGLSAGGTWEAAEPATSDTPSSPVSTEEGFDAVVPSFEEGLSQSESEAVEPEAEPASAEAQADLPLAAPTKADADASALPGNPSHEGRLTSNRRRVKGLVAALRAEREQATLWQLSVAEREAALLTAQEQIDEASAAAELNEATRQELAEALERIAALEAEHANALAAAEAATERAESLEQQLAAQEAALAEPPKVASVKAPERAPEVAVASELTADTVEPPEEPEPALPIWSQEPAADLPAMDRPIEPTAIEDAEASIEDETPLASAPLIESIDAEGMWGIERLASEQGLPADAEPVGLAAEELVEATLTEADASVPEPEQDNPSAFAETSHEDPQAPSIDPPEASYESADLAPALEPAVELEPEATEAPAEPAETATEFKDPFARPETDASSEPHEAPASFIEQYAHLIPEDDEAVAEPVSLAEPAPVVAEVAPVAESEDDESIDDYMRKLMGRVRGDSPAASESAPAPVGVQAEPAAEPVEPEMPQVAEPIVPIRDLSEMKRVPNREITTDMGELRKLANQSARHAIDVAETRQSREYATLRLTASAVAIGCGALAAITAFSPFDLQFVGGIVGLSAGSWFGLRTLRACQKAAAEEKLEAIAAGESIG